MITFGSRKPPLDVFYKLGNVEELPSQEFIPDVPMVTVNLSSKVGLTVTNLLYEVDLVLGMTWLQLNPVVHWSNGKSYVPNAVQNALL